MSWFWDPTRCSLKWWLSSFSPILPIRWHSTYLIPCLNHHSPHSSKNSSAFIWSYMRDSLIFLATPSVLDTLFPESVFFFLTLSVIIILGNFIIHVNNPSNTLPEIKYIMKNHLLYLKCTVPINGLFFLQRIWHFVNFGKRSWILQLYSTILVLIPVLFHLTSIAFSLLPAEWTKGLYSILHPRFSVY